MRSLRLFNIMAFGMALFVIKPAHGAEIYRLTCMASVCGMLNEPQDFVLADGVQTLNGVNISAESEIGRTTSDDGPTFSTAIHRWRQP